MLAQLVVDHITLLVFVLISACCVDKWDTVLQNVPTKGKRLPFSPGKRAFGTYALGCAVFDSPCCGAPVEEIEQDQDEEDIEDFVAFPIKSLEGFAILAGGATKTVSGFMSVTRAPRLRRQMLALRSLVAKRRQQARKTVFHTLSSRKEFRRTSQHRFSSTWMCYVSTGWSSTTTSIVFAVTS